MKINLNAKQRPFCNSKVRYPCFVGAWASGKTMCGLIKGVQLSEAYPKNLGLIVRKKYTDLRDSTLKDFEKYFPRYKVNVSNKECLLGNKSLIMFRHGEELSGLQNVNLGWFMIEQGEEFESAEQFDLLRGRLRRDVGLRQGFVIANTAGHNWIWDRWKSHKSEGYELYESTTFDNAKNVPADFIEDLKRMEIEAPKKYKRYVLNSWEDYDLEGAYYASMMSDALVDGRICSVGYDDKYPVYTFWDIGDIYTAIWFAQFYAGRCHIIDYYYDNSGLGLPRYVEAIRAKDYQYETHFAPFDIQGSNAKSFQTGRTTLDVASELGIEFDVLPQHRVEDRIEAARNLLKSKDIHSVFDSEKCKEGIEALNHYKKKKNDTLSTENRTVYVDTPLHSWSSHGADAFGYMAMAWKYGNFDSVAYPFGSTWGGEVKKQKTLRELAMAGAVDDFDPEALEEESLMEMFTE